MQEKQTSFFFALSEREPEKNIFVFIAVGRFSVDIVFQRLRCVLLIEYNNFIDGAFIIFYANNSGQKCSKLSTQLKNKKKTFRSINNVLSRF